MPCCYFSSWGLIITTHNCILLHICNCIKLSFLLNTRQNYMLIPRLNDCSCFFFLSFFRPSLWLLQKIKKATKNFKSNRKVFSSDHERNLLALSLIGAYQATVFCLISLEIVSWKITPCISRFTEQMECQCHSIFTSTNFLLNR